jgi:beta-phosphoglucomutase family hydrolase
MVAVNSKTAFLFDMDGVIIDSTSLHTEAWRAYTRQHGIETHDIERRMLGKHNAEIVRDFFGNTALPEHAVAEHGANKEKIYREMMRPVFEQQLVPGVIDFVRRHRSHPMGVATNAEPENVEFVLGLAGIRDCFGAIVNGHDVPRPKPYPDMYLKVAVLLGVQPGQCVVFEDSHTGVAAARGAGMRVVGVKTTVPEFDGVDFAVINFLEPELETWLRELA